MQRESGEYHICIPPVCEPGIGFHLLKRMFELSLFLLFCYLHLAVCHEQIVYACK